MDSHQQRSDPAGLDRRAFLRTSAGALASGFLASPTRLLLPGGLAMAGLSTAAEDSIPAGAADAFEKAAEELIAEGDVLAAQLCVIKGGQTVVNRAFGRGNAESEAPLPTNSRFRLASLDKVITSTAIHQLIEAQARFSGTDERMDLELRPFILFREMGLDAGADGKTDPRVFDITIRHLLQHESGLNQDVHDTPTLQRVLGLGRLPVPQDAIRYHFRTPLSFDPGSQSSYNSAGYWLLRILIQMAKGHFIGYMRDHVFAPAGATDVCLSHTRPSDRDPLEVQYQCDGTGPSLIPDDRSRVIPRIDGGGEYNDNHLVIAASAESVAKYLSYWYFGEAKRLWLTDPATLAPDLNNGGGVFHGGMTGIRTVMIQRRWSMCSIAFLTNWIRNKSGVEPQNFATRLEKVCEDFGW